MNQESGFTRTPKTGSEGKRVQDVKKSYRGKKSWLPALELAFDPELERRLAGIVESADAYWDRRSALPWN